jgi:two-component system LytT family response regulator
MESITALIIDDETHNRNVLKTLLKKHCPGIQVIGEANSAESAFAEITEKQPRLVFLDIKMPERSGFDLLRMFEEIDFEVIFVSAFNEYAITAFEFNALAYILKPIDFSKLISAVGKAVSKIKLNKSNSSVFHFIKTVEEKNDLIGKINIHHGGSVILLNISDIISLESIGDSVEIKTINGEHFYSTKEIKLFDRLLNVHRNFVRISRGVIINTSHIVSYSKGDTCILEMHNRSSFEVSRRKKAEALAKIRLL